MTLPKVAIYMIDLCVEQATRTKVYMDRKCPIKNYRGYKIITKVEWNLNEHFMQQFPRLQLNFFNNKFKTKMTRQNLIHFFCLHCGDKKSTMNRLRKREKSQRVLIFCTSRTTLWVLCIATRKNTVNL